VILSSDGMHGLITDDEIAEVAGMLPLEEAAQRLVDTANERGGPDNITVVIARVDELDPGAPAESPEAVPTTPLASAPTERLPELPAAPAEKPLSRLGAILAALTLALLIGAGAFVTLGGRGAPAAAATPSPAPTASPAATRAAPTPAPSATP
jgi:protein phosphatase